MAAIDFPASPVNGQIFVGGNGVTYRWNGTLWLSTGASAGGDFCAYSLGGAFSSTGSTVVGTVLSGNSGGYYNTSNGRFTPPAGRYCLYGWMSASSTSAANILFLTLRKNGVTVAPGSANAQSINTGVGVLVSFTLTMDAVGTDFFDVQVATNAANATCSQIVFGAFPISGIQGPPGTPFGYNGGDFMATHNAGFALPANTPSPLALNTVTIGNSGSWYSTSTGRYVPPAGRHFLYGMFSSAGASGGAISTVTLYKNGVALPNQTGSANTSAISLSSQITAQAIVDANGTDYFQLVAYSNVATTAASQAYFGAFPLSGIQGPPGPPGTVGQGWRLLDRQVLVSPAALLDFTGIPSDINDLELRLDLTPVTNDTTLTVRWYDGTSTLLTTGYDWTTDASQTNIAAGGASAVMSSTAGASNTWGALSDARTARAAGNTSGLRARATFNNIRDAARRKSYDFTAGYLSSDATCFMAVTGSGWRPAATALTGLRVAFGTGNIAAGGTMSIWGSP